MHLYFKCGFEGRKPRNKGCNIGFTRKVNKIALKEVYIEKGGQAFSSALFRQDLFKTMRGKKREVYLIRRVECLIYVDDCSNIVQGIKGNVKNQEKQDNRGIW